MHVSVDGRTDARTEAGGGRAAGESFGVGVAGAHYKSPNRYRCGLGLAGWLAGWLAGTRWTDGDGRLLAWLASCLPGSSEVLNE